MWTLLTPLVTSVVTQCSILEAAFSSLQSGPATIPPRSLWRDRVKKTGPPFSLPNTWQSRSRGALLPSGSELSSQAWTDTRTGKRATFKTCLHTCVCAIMRSSWKEIFSFYCRWRGRKIKLITAKLLLPFNNQGCQSGDNFMLTVWSRSLGGCGGELRERKSLSSCFSFSIYLWPWWQHLGKFQLGNYLQ